MLFLLLSCNHSHTYLQITKIKITTIVSLQAIFVTQQQSDSNDNENDNDVRPHSGAILSDIYERSQAEGSNFDGGSSPIKSRIT